MAMFSEEVLLHSVLANVYDFGSNSRLIMFLASLAASVPSRKLCATVNMGISDGG